MAILEMKFPRCSRGCKGICTPSILQDNVHVGKRSRCHAGGRISRLNVSLTKDAATSRLFIWLVSSTLGDLSLFIPHARLQKT